MIHSKVTGIDAPSAKDESGYRKAIAELRTIHGQVLPESMVRLSTRICGLGPVARGSRMSSHQTEVARSRRVVYALLTR